jgi:nucleotide-binding universal stress UspA family protein
VATETGEQRRSRFVVAATGCLCSADVPDIDGLDTFQGETSAGDVSTGSDRGRCSGAGRWHRSDADPFPAQEEAPVPDRSSAQRRITVGVDGSESARRALGWALAEAELHDAVLQPVYVWQYPPRFRIPVMPVISTEALRRAADDLLADEVEKVLHGRGVDVTLAGTILEGPPALRLTEAAEGADLLVVGARGARFAAAFGLGSVSQQCLHRSTAPVGIVRDDLHLRRTTGQVAVGVDGSDDSLEAVAWAADEARRRGAALAVVMAWSLLNQPVTEDDTRVFDQRAAEQVLEDLLDARAHQIGDLEVTRTVVCDRPADVLVDAARAADLLVVGARGLGGFTRFALGSVSHHVTQLAPVPVVVVPQGRSDAPASPTTESR